MAVDFLALEPIVKKAARDAHKTFPQFHDVSDTEQAIWMGIYEQTNSIEDIIRNSTNREWSKPIYDIALLMARSHLKKEDAAWHGYGAEDEYYYSNDLIKEILEVVFQHEDWQSFATVLDKMPKGKSDPATAGNNLASYVDVSRALKEIKEEQYNLIVWKYKYLYTYEAIGTELGITRQAAQQRHEVAVSAIQKALGRRDLGELRKGSDPELRPYGVADALAQSERNYNG